MLPSGQVTVLDVYGSLLFAGSRTLRAAAARPHGIAAAGGDPPATGPDSLGATFFQVVSDYAQRLGHVGGRLYLPGVDPALLRQLENTGRVEVSGPIRTVAATEVIGESTLAAVHAAEAWLVEHRPTEPGPLSD